MPINSHLRPNRIYALRDGSHVIQVEHLLQADELPTCLIPGYRCCFHEPMVCNACALASDERPPICTELTYSTPGSPRTFYTYLRLTYDSVTRQYIAPDGTRIRIPAANDLCDFETIRLTFNPEAYAFDWVNTNRTGTTTTRPKKTGRKWPKFLPD